MQMPEFDKTAITISHNSMSAFLRLPEPLGGQEYSLENIRQALADSGVTAGINVDVIQNMIQGHIYEQTVSVANGREPKPGVDGFYDFKFDRKLDGKPRIREDGSVDYAIKLFEVVTEGQVIAVYHPAVHGVDGFTVKGDVLRAKPGRDRPTLRGKGFKCQDDGITYVATTGGKIDMVNDKIMILPVFEINSDADSTTGNIDFRGDVIVHGNVDEIEIHATGFVNVTGVVQGGSIYAGKDIVISSGVLGNGKSVIDAKGSISAKFFEFSTVRSKGDITADIFMNCNVYCEGEAILMNRKGCIVGGSVHAVCGIEANSIGNSAEIQTNILVGNGGAVRRKVEELKNSIRESTVNINQIESLLEKFEELERKTGQSMKDDPRRVQLVRIRVRDMARKASDSEELRKLETMIDNAQNAAVKVRRKVYPGVKVSIDTCDVSCKDTFSDIIFIKERDNVVMRRLSEWGAD